MAEGSTATVRNERAHRSRTPCDILTLFTEEVDRLTDITRSRTSSASHNLSSGLLPEGVTTYLRKRWSSLLGVETDCFDADGWGRVRGTFLEGESF